MALTSDISKTNVDSVTKVETNSVVWNIDACGNVVTTINGSTYYLGARDNKDYARLCIYGMEYLENEHYSISHINSTSTKKYTKTEQIQYELDRVSVKLNQKSKASYKTAAGT